MENNNNKVYFIKYLYSNTIYNKPFNPIHGNNIKFIP